jgi:hypothetical protein
MSVHASTLSAGARPGERREDILATVPAWSCVVALFVGDVVLAGWLADVETWKSLLPGYSAMNPLTAFALTLAGLSLWLQRDGDRGRVERIGSRACAIAVTLIATARLAGMLLGSSGGVDTWLFADKLAIGAGWRVRMSPQTAVVCALIGAALALADVTTRRGRRPARHLALAAVLVAAYAIVAGAFGAHSLYGADVFKPIALPTAAAFLLTGLGVLAVQPHAGLIGIAMGGTAGGAFARRLIPAGMAVPLVLGGLAVAGFRAGLYDPSTAIALVSVGAAVALAMAVHAGGAAVDRAGFAATNMGEPAFAVPIDSPALGIEGGIDSKPRPAGQPPSDESNVPVAASRRTEGKTEPVRR